ncbi:MAG TPA: hypothetical protein VIJ94_05080 [Caulobacteraceae bacterium]
MAHRTLTALSAVALMFLFAASALVWGEFGAFGVSLVRAWTGG